MKRVRLRELMRFYGGRFGFHLEAQQVADLTDWIERPMQAAWRQPQEHVADAPGWLARRLAESGVGAVQPPAPDLCQFCGTDKSVGMHGPTVCKSPLIKGPQPPAPEPLTDHQLADVALALACWRDEVVSRVEVSDRIRSVIQDQPKETGP